MPGFKVLVEQFNGISWTEELECGTSIIFLSTNIKMLLKNQHPKQGEEAYKENASCCHLCWSKH